MRTHDLSLWALGHDYVMAAEWRTSPVDVNHSRGATRGAGSPSPAA